MQSSPPQRASHHPPSPTTSNYSINLDALELDSQSGASTPLPTQQIDRVLTSDIDGPSDFTLNMEKWMRGGTLRKKGLGSVKEKREVGVTAAAEGGTDAGTGREGVPGVGRVDEAQSNHTPSNSPPKQSVLGEDRFEDDDGSAVNEDGEKCDPDWEADTPRTAQRDEEKRFLQPSVEEYCSELIPAKFAYSTSKEDSTRHKSGDEYDRRVLHDHDVTQSEGGLPSPLSSPAQSPISQHAPIHLSQSQSRTDGLEQELQQLRARCEHLENINNNLTQTLTSERQQRQTDTAAHAAQISDFQRREQDLTDMKTQSQQHSSDFRREFSEMKERLAAYETLQAGHKAELERLKQAHAIQVQDLQAQLERERNEHAHELGVWEQDVELAKRSREDAEESAKLVQEELEERSKEVEKLKTEIEQGEELREGIKEQLRVARMDAERSRLDADTDGKVQALKAEHDRVVGDLTAQLEEVQRELESEREGIESQPSPPDVGDEVEEEFRAEYNDAIIERDSLQDEVTSLKAELTEEREGRDSDRAATAVVGDAFNARIAAAIRTREQYWRARISEAKDERKVMAKALLRAWGREEMGNTHYKPRSNVLPQTPPSEDEYEFAERVGGGEQVYRYMFGGRRDGAVEDAEAREGEDVIEVLEMLDKERQREKGDRRVVLDLP